MKKSICSFILCTLSLCTLQAATYYASPNGTGSGSFNDPCSFKAGLGKLSAPGDTLYLFSGQYDLMTTDVNNLNGSSSRRIVISGYDGMNAQGSYDAILDFRQTAYGTGRGLQIKNTCSYVHVKNLTLRYSGKNNLINYGSNNLFENLDIYGSADTGCQMKNGGNNIIKNVDSHDNFDYETLSNGTANFGGNADGFADKQFTGDGNHYIGCRAWNNSDDGWDFFQRVSTSNTIIENCVCYVNGAPYYDMSAHPRVTGVDKTWFDGKVGTQMTDRYGNTITISLAKFPCQGNGNGFKMGGDGTNHKLLIHHCLAVGNYARGFDQNNNGGSMWVYNNTAYDNHTNYGFTTACGTNTIQNCISFRSRHDDSYRSQTAVSINHNSWNNGYSCSASDFLSLDTTQILAPRQADGSLPDGMFMRLASGSSLIDAGINVNLGYNGNAPDLGCYETDGEHHEPEPEAEDEMPKPDGKYSVAYVTVFDSDEDQTLLAHLFENDSLWVTQTNALVPDIDYSVYDIIVISSKPNSGAAGLADLKGYNKPMVVLKPFLFKPNVWNWGTPVNTTELDITVTRPEHPLFQGLTVTNGHLNVFSACNTNAVTGISEWVNTEGFEVLGTSKEGLTVIAEFPTGTSCNGTILTQPLIMIGVSEYSTIYLTDEGKKLIENAILYQLGITMPQGIENQQTPIIHHKFINNGTLYLQSNGIVYDVNGHRVVL